MSDSFINKLNETTKIKGGDYTVFDVADNTLGGFYTKKITYENLTNAIKADVIDALHESIVAIQDNLNTVSKTIGDKLDKKGLTFASTERMTGPLVLNSGAKLSAFDEAHFNATVNLHNNNIINLKDGVNDYDAINLHQLKSAIAAVPTPDTTTFVLKSGSTMTGALKLPSGDPTDSLHAANKQYVDSKISQASPAGSYLPLSGGTVTGAITLPSGDPTNNLHAANKAYVDKMKASPLDFLPLSGGTMTGELNLKGFSEILGTPASNAGTITLDLATGNTFSVKPTANVTSFGLTNVPSNSLSFTLIIESNGGFSVSWTFTGYTVKWPDNNPPVLTSTGGKIDIFSFLKIGNTIYGFLGGQNF